MSADSNGFQRVAADASGCQRISAFTITSSSVGFSADSKKSSGSQSLDVTLELCFPETRIDWDLIRPKLHLLSAFKSESAISSQWMLSSKVRVSRAINRQAQRIRFGKSRMLWFNVTQAGSGTLHNKQSWTYETDVNKFNNTMSDVQKRPYMQAERDSDKAVAWHRTHRQSAFCGSESHNTCSDLAWLSSKHRLPMLNIWFWQGQTVGCKKHSIPSSLMFCFQYVHLAVAVSSWLNCHWPLTACS